MADFDLGTARGHIEIDASGAEFGIGKATKSVQGIDTALGSVGGTMQRAGALLTAGAAGIAAGFAVAINSAANFEQSIGGIAAVSNASGAELDQIRKKALQLGADTVFSATEAAGAIEELVKAGVPIKDVMNGAADATTALAAAGGIGLKEAATIAANAMNTFNIAAKDMPRIADVLAGAANASAADVSQLGQALQQVGAVAETVGLSFEDTVTALAALADAGIKGSDAGTSLKTFLVNLNPSTKEAAELMERLGIATYEGGVSSDDYKDALKELKPAQDDVRNAQKDLNDLLADFKAQDIDATARAQAQKMDDVTRATKGVADAQRDYNELQERLTAGNVQTAQELQTKKLEAQRKATEQLSAATGALNDLKDRQAASGEAKTDLERVSRAQQLRDATERVTEAQKALGEAGKIDITPNVETAVSRQQQLQDALRKVGEAQGKLNEARNAPDTAKLSETERVNRAQALRDANEKVAETTTKLDGTNKVLSEGIGHLNNKFFDSHGHLKSLAEVSQVLQDALKGQTDQQKLATLQTLFGTDAIRAASVISKEGAGGIKQLYGEMSKASAADVAGKRMQNLKGDMEQFKGSVDTALITFGEMFQPVIRAVTQTLTGLTNAFSDLSPTTQRVLAAVGIVGGGLLAFAGTALFVGGTILKLKKTYDALKEGIEALKVAEKAGKAMDALNASFLTNPVFLIVAALVALGVGLYELYKHSETFRKFVDGLWQGIQNAWDNIMPVLDAIAGGFQTLWGIVEPILMIFVNYFVNNLKAAFEIVMGIFNVFAGLFTGDWGRMWDGVKGIFGGVWDLIRNYFGTIIKLLTSDLAGMIVDILAKFGNFMLDLLTSAGKGLWNLLGKFGEFMTELPAKFAYMIGFLIGMYIKLWVDMIQLAIEWVPKIIEAIIGFFINLPGNIWDTVKDLGPALVGWFLGFATDAGIGMANGFVDMLNWFVGLPGKVWNIIKTFGPALAGWLGGFAKNAGIGMMNGFVDLLNFFIGLPGKVWNSIKDLADQMWHWFSHIGSSAWEGFKHALFGSPHTKVEYAMWDLTDNVGKSIETLKRQVKTVQDVGSGINATNAMLSTPSLSLVGARSVGDLASGGQSTVVHGDSTTVAGDSTVVHAHTDADPIEIAEEIAWKKRLRTRVA